MNTILEEIEQSEPEKSPEHIIDEAIAALKKGDDGAHWESVVMEAARNLYKEDKALFQRKRSELKKASKDSQITDWTKEIRGSGDDSEDSTKADELVNIVKVGSELFHNSRNIGYTTFNHNNHTETWALGSMGFNDWLGFKSYTELGFSPSDTTIKQAITTLKGIAKYEGKEHEVYQRCAPCQDGYIIDLSNEQWQAIQVTSIGWEIVNHPETRFIRSSTATELPIPTKGDLNLLWKHINILEKQQPLILAYILESWRTDTPFTILILTGEQGSAKSSTHKRLRQISDPNDVPLRAAPKTIEDIYISAANNWQASFENMSNLSNGMQDALCTLATGGGFAARKLYSDADESVIEVKRPVIINGISNVATRPDLIDRIIEIHLPKIEESKRKCDAELEQAFEKDMPAIFGGLLDLFAATLKELPSINIEKPPRMIDFSYLGEAMCKALNLGISFNELYKENRSDSLSHSLESSPAALAVLEMMQSRNDIWEGTLKTLKNVLEKDHYQEGEGWPRSPRGLGEILRRMTPALRELGVEIEFLKRKNNGIPVRLLFSPVYFESVNNVHNIHTYTDSVASEQNTTNSSSNGERVNMVNVEIDNKNDVDKGIPLDLNVHPHNSFLSNANTKEYEF